MDEPDPEQAMAASEELNAYLEELVVKKNAKPGDDVLSTLAVEQFRTGAMTPREIAVLGQLLLAAGHDTTASMFTLGTVTLLTHPDQLRTVRDSDDPALVANAVEELLRYLSITHTEARRVAREDVEIGGQLIRAGEGIIAAKSTANRDSSAFPDPDSVDVRRKARHHFAFGPLSGRPTGPCRAAGRLQHPLPAHTDAGAGHTTEELAFNENAVFCTLRELPVTW